MWDRGRANSSVPRVIAAILASTLQSGCTAIEGLWSGSTTNPTVEHPAPSIKLLPNLFRTADGNLVLEVPQDEFEFDPVSGQFQLGPNAQRVLLPLGRPDSERFVGLKRETTLDQYMASIDEWVDGQIKDFAQQDKLTVDGTEISKHLGVGADERYGFNVSDRIQAIGLADLPGKQLTAIPAPYRLLIGIYVGVAGVSLIAFSIAATATGAVIVAPPLFIAGTSLSGIGTSLVLSVVYSEGQEAAFEQDIQKIKAILRDAAARAPLQSAFGATLFDTKGFGYAAGLALPNNVSRVFPLGDDRVLMEDGSGTLFEVQYGDLRVRRVRSGPQRLRWVVDQGDQIVAGFGLRDVVIMDRKTLAERRRWLVPRSIGHDRVRFRYLSRYGMVIQDQTNQVYLDSLTGEDAKPVAEINQAIYWITEDEDRLVVRIGERDFLGWNPSNAHIDRVRTLEGWKADERETAALNSGSSGAWSWFHRPNSRSPSRTSRTTP